MTEFKENTEVKIGSERNFGMVFAFVFTIIGLFPLLHGNPPRLWGFAVAGVFFGLGLFIPSVLRPLNKAWFAFGMLLGRIIAPIVMSLVFLITVIPTGLMLRLFGKDPMRRKLQPEAKSYWQDRDAETDPMRSMKNQF